ncbi:zinc-binding dehydrogenase [Kolteria novifilia]
MAQRSGRWSALAFGAGFEGALALVALLLGWMTGFFPFAGTPWTWGDGLLGVVGTLPLLLLFVLLVHWPIGPLVRIRAILQQTLLPFLAPCRVGDLALIALLAGVGEEMLFRGWMQPLVASWIGPVGGLLIASLLFGFAHYVSMAYLVIAAGIGVYLGLLWMVTGNLFAPIVTHALYDFVGLIYLLRVHRWGGSEAPDPIVPEDDDFTPIPTRKGPVSNQNGPILNQNGPISNQNRPKGEQEEMKAAYIEQTGPANVIQFGELPKPTISGNEVLVRVEAAALNPVDTYIRSGGIPMELPQPFIVGSDLAGVIEDVGPDVTERKVGERVWSTNLGSFGRQGTFAEYAAVDASWLRPISEGVDSKDAVAMALVGTTAHLGLFERAQLQAGEVFFINGGSGGVGSAAVQMAKIAGATVITTAGSEEKAAICRELGADHVLLYKSQDVAAEVAKIAPEGIDVYWETLREPNFEQIVGMIARNGRIVVMAGRDATPPFPVGPFYVKNASLLGLIMFAYDAEGQRKSAEDISRWMAEGKLRSRIDRVMPLAEAAEAHRIQEESTVAKSGSLSGKIVLVP